MSQLAFEKLRGAANTAQRILDFVRESAHELARRLLHRHVMIVAVDAQQAIERPDLEQQLSRGRVSNIGETV